MIYIGTNTPAESHTVFDDTRWTGSLHKSDDRDINYIYWMSFIYVVPTTDLLPYVIFQLYS